MKKLIAVLLSIIMLMGCFNLGVFAATDDSKVDVEEVIQNDVLDVYLTSDTVTAHTSAELNLVIRSNPGFSVMILKLTYANKNISLSNAQCSVDGVSVEFSNSDGYSTVAFYHLSGDCTATGTLAVLTFDVGAAFGDTEVTLSAEEGDVCNFAAEIIEPVLAGATITAQCISDTHYLEYVGTTPASCSKEGEIKYVCTVCGYEDITLIDKTAHSFSADKKIISEPDCDDEGIKAPVCEYCFAIDESKKETIAPLGHKYPNEEPTVTKEPTCTEVGSEYEICYVCNFVHVMEIAPLGHDDGTWRTNIPSDCENAGEAARFCNRCDAVLETKVKDVGDHFYAWSVVKQPTCTEEGIEHWLCVVCGGHKTDERTIPVLPHTPGEEVIAKEPTCSEKGVAEIRCEDCDHLISSREIEKLEHVKNSLTVVSAPTSEKEGIGEYRCKECDEVIETVELPVTNALFRMETVPTLAGKTTAVKVYLENNPGFAYGVLRIKYDVASLVYEGVEAGEITSDIIAGVPAEGEISVLISLEDAEYFDNGLVFTVNFILTAEPKDTALELTYDPQNDFSDNEGNRVFVNTESGKIDVLAFVRGDCNGDGEVDTTDLAVLKLYLAGVNDTIGEGADIDKNQKLDTGDLATLKLFLAGVIKF
ncbi:MAG: hypothetical protein IJ946_02295 [Clostridia bacterium]|nr:hypothetical protein [Clostridia bacterium]